MSTLERKIMVHSYLLARFTKTLGATRALDPCLAHSTPRRLTSKQGRREGGGGAGTAPPVVWMQWWWRRRSVKWHISISRW